MSRTGGSGSTQYGLLTLAFAAGVLAFHVAMSHGYGYFRDELYYLACSAHPALGYVDFAPLLALVLGPWRTVFGDSLPSLRFLPALAAASLVCLTAALVRALGGGRLALVVAAVPVIVAPIYLGTFSILTPNALDVVAWAAVLLVVVRLLDQPTRRDWIALGMLLAVGFWNRHGIVFLVAGLAAGLVLTPARRLVGTRGPWIAAAVAGVLVLPHLVWQALHGWPTLEFLANARRTKMLEQSAGAFVLEQIIVLDPPSAAVWVTGLVSLWRRDAGRYRALVVAYATMLVLMIAGAGKAYYLTPFYPVLFAAGAVALARRPLLATAVAVLVLLGGVAGAPLAKPLLAEERLADYARTLGLDPRMGAGERHELGVLPQHFADQHGWPELAATVARVLDRLPHEERARACIYASNYGEAGAIDFFGPPLGLPPAISGHNSYWTWGPRGCDFSTVVVLGLEPADVRDNVLSVVEADRVDCPYCMPYERRPLLVTRGLTIPRDELWRRARFYR